MDQDLARRSESHWVSVTSMADVGNARRRFAEWSAEAGVDTQGVGRIEMVATELATNLARHACGRRRMWWAPQLPDGNGVPPIAIVAVDEGPGIPDIERAMADDYSTGGSLGIGLGAVARHSDSFATWTRTSDPSGRVRSGTVIASVIGCVSEPPLYALGRRLAGESACGDRVYIGDGPEPIVAVIDGLGHGQGASMAADAAVCALESSCGASIEELFAAMGRELTSTRGAAVSLVRLGADTIEWAGVGNVSGRLISAKTSHLLPMGGTLGMHRRQVRVERISRPHSGVMVLWSDGVSDRWSLSDFGLDESAHPLVLAALLHRDKDRDTDDATVLALRV